MTTEHWQSFQKQQSFKFTDSAMPIDAVELERQRRKQSGFCSAKSLFCCLSVLVGQSTKAKSTKQRRQPIEVLRREDDDDSFGYNFDDQMSPRVMTRLATSGHNFDWRSRGRNRVVCPHHAALVCSFLRNCSVKTGACIPNLRGMDCLVLLGEYGFRSQYPVSQFATESSNKTMLFWP